MNIELFLVPANTYIKTQFGQSVHSFVRAVSFKDLYKDGCLAYTSKNEWLCSATGPDSTYQVSGLALQDGGQDIVEADRALKQAGQVTVGGGGA